MKKKIILIIVGIFLAVIVMAGMTFAPFIKGALSVTKLDENLYTLEYTGDDGFSGLLEQGGASDALKLAAYVTEFISHGYYKLPQQQQDKKLGCATFTVSTPDKQILTGRNLDNPPALAIIYKVHPKDGYSYISTFDGSQFGFGEGWKPEGFMNQYLALAGLFVALDGVNEKGLAVADLNAGSNEETHQSSGKPDLTTTAAIKYLLKSAATVKEAVELLGKIDMHSDIGCLHHLSLSDASGHSAVAEWVGDKLVVTETPAVTNHYLCPEKYGYSLVEGDHRYETLLAARDSLNNTMTSQQLLESMASIFQVVSNDDGKIIFGTQWTVLFNLSSPSADYYWQRDLKHSYHFDL